jgi:hypothetical protein
LEPRTPHDVVAEQRGAAADAARTDVHKTKDVNDELGTNVEQIILSGQVEKNILKATAAVELQLALGPYAIVLGVAYAGLSRSDEGVVAGMLFAGGGLGRPTSGAPAQVRAASPPKPSPAQVEAEIKAGLAQAEKHAEKTAAALKKQGGTQSEAAAGAGSAPIRKVGDLLNTVDDVMANPKLLSGLKRPQDLLLRLEGRVPDQWKVEALGKGSHKGQGWVLREYSAGGDPTGRMIRWHPGGTRHGPGPYWRVTGYSEKSGVIR